MRKEFREERRKGQRVRGAKGERVHLLSPSPFLLLSMICFQFTIFNFAFASGVAVTAVKVEQKSAEITLNDAILIRDIQVSREGGLSIKFPEYVSRRERVYPQVKILNAEADETIRRAIQTGKAQGTPKVWEPKKDMKITEFKRWTGERGFWYIAEVTFGDAVAISCRVEKGKRGVWVRWPARPPQEGSTSRKWIQQVQFLDKSFQDRVEKILTQKYESEEAKVKQQTQQQKLSEKSAKEKLKQSEEE